MIAHGLDVASGRPMATDPAPASDRRTQSDGQRSMWEREMERAQTESWFRQPARPSRHDPALETDGSRSGSRASPDVAEFTGAHEGQRLDHDSLGRPSPMHDTASTSLHPAPGRRPIPAVASVPIRVVQAASTSCSGGADDHGVPAGDSSGRDAGAVGPTPEPSQGMVGPSRRTSAPSVPTAAAGATAAGDASNGETRSMPPATTASPSSGSATPPAGRGSLDHEDDDVQFPTEAVNVRSGDAAMSMEKSAALSRALGSAMAVLEPIRLHIERTEAAVSVWIGTDRDMAAQLPQLVASVTEALAQSGVRLRSIVCNGIRRYHDGDAGRISANDGNRYLDITMESES